jgi:hypothetical protein
MLPSLQMVAKCCELSNECGGFNFYVTNTVEFANIQYFDQQIHLLKYNKIQIITAGTINT